MKFHIGEIAILIGLPSPYEIFNGLEVEIYSIACFVGGHVYDYCVVQKDGDYRAVDEKNLRKRPQPGIPQSILRIFDEPVSA